MSSECGVEGTTALDPEEAAQLLPAHLTSREQLNAWEQANIALAAEWAVTRRADADVLSLPFLKELHRRMFDQTWRWAGRFRTTQTNLGITPNQIPEQLANLLADTQHWIEHATYPTDEIATRFHHRLVAIHPFPNGNGRHGRLATDRLLFSRGAAMFTWGSSNLIAAGDARAAYLIALKRADLGSLEELLRFARS